MRGKMAVLTVLFVLICGGILSAAERGAARGTVLVTQVWKGEEGRLMLSVTIRTDEGAKRTFSVGPGKREAYATVGMLQEGQRVTIGWVSEGDRLWIREIVTAERREGGERAEKKERERHEKGRVERKEREHKEQAEVEKKDQRRHEMTEKDRNTEAKIAELEKALDKLQKQLNELREQLRHRQRERD